MQNPQVVVRFELAGWELFFAELEKREGSGANLADVCSGVAEAIRETLRLEDLPKHPPIAAVRRLFKEAGCDPSRYRPSSEALIRRLLKGEAIPSIHPLVDINNCLSARLAVPCCVMAKGSFSPPFIFRAGRAGETYESLRGSFRLDRKPLLVDAQGPCDAPITGSQRVKVTQSTQQATLVAYLPKAAVTADDAREELEHVLSQAPAAAILHSSVASP